LSPVSTGIGDDLWQVYHPSIYPGPLSLAIPPWVGAMSTGDGFGRTLLDRFRDPTLSLVFGHEYTYIYRIIKHTQCSSDAL